MQKKKFLWLNCLQLLGIHDKMENITGVQVDLWRTNRCSIIYSLIPVFTLPLLYNKCSTSLGKHPPPQQRLAKTQKKGSKTRTQLLLWTVDVGNINKETMSDGLFLKPGSGKHVHFDEDNRESMVDIYVSTESLRVYDIPWVEEPSPNSPGPSQAQSRSKSLISNLCNHSSVLSFSLAGLLCMHV